MRGAAVLDKPFAENMRRVGKDRVGIAIGLLEPHQHVVCSVAVNQRRIVCKGRRTAGDRRQGVVIHFNQHSGILCLVARIRNDQRDHFADMADFFTGKQPRRHIRPEIGCRKLQGQTPIHNMRHEIRQGVDRPDAWCRHRRGRMR